MIDVQAIADAPPPAPVVLFLHGIDGDALSAWGQSPAGPAFPHRLAQRFPGLQVVSVGYPASLKLYAEDSRLSLAEVAARLAHALPTLLAGRSAVSIVGYCLGALTMAMALRSLASRAALPAVQLFAIDAPLREPEIDPFPVVGATLRLGEREMAAVRAWLLGRFAPGRFELVTVLSSGPGWLAPYAPDSLSPPAPLYRVSGDHLAVALAPAAGPFEPLEVVERELRAFLGRIALQEAGAS